MLNILCSFCLPLALETNMIKDKRKTPELAQVIVRGEQVGYDVSSFFNVGHTLLANEVFCQQSTQ